MTTPATSPRRVLCLRRKLAIVILLAGLLPLVAATIVSYAIARDALIEDAEQRLSLMLGEKETTLRGYVERVSSVARLVADARSTEEALVALAAAWPGLPESLGWPAAEAATAAPEAAARRDEALRSLSQFHVAQSGPGSGQRSTLPASLPAQAAQVLFITENPHPPGSKHLLERPTRGASPYGEAHAGIHPYLAAVVRDRRYEDLLLVDAASGTIVYSVAKDVDLGASVREGPFAGTGLGVCARQALEADTVGAVAVTDWSLYPTAAGKPAVFIGAAVRVGGRTIGALVLQLSSERVNDLFEPEPGVRPSTETILVGADLLLRTDSRFEPPGTALHKRVESQAIREALAGRAGRGVELDYRGVRSAVAYRPLELAGHRFALVRKVDEAEALAPVRRLLYWMGGITLGLVGLAFLAALTLSRALARPVTAATSHLTTTAQTLLSTAQEQQAGAAEAAAAVEETRQTFTGVLGAAQSLRETGTEVLGHAEVSQRNAQTIGRRIQELSQNTAHIGEILTLVKEIANRSDLLALNAALEGTKAGEAGRGFSLVASQMQRLAEEVMGSVKRIDALTQDITRASAGAVLAAEEAGKVAAQTTGSAQHIAEAVQSQQAATEQVSVAMNEIATVAQNSVDASRRIVTASNDLLGVAEALRRAVGS